MDYFLEFCLKVYSIYFPACNKRILRSSEEFNMINRMTEERKEMDWKRKTVKH